MHGTFKYLHKYFGYRAEVTFFIPLPSPKFILKKKHLRKYFAGSASPKYSKKYYILHPNKPIWASILFPPVSIFGQSYICLFQIAIPKVSLRITIPKVIILLTSISMVQYLNFKRIVHIAEVGAVASDLSGIVVIRIKLNPPLFVKIY